jgi:hypothetical protein
MRLVALVLATTALSCGRPGVVVEIYNDSTQEILVRQAYNDVSTTTHSLAPGERGAFGPALSWHVSMLGSVFEVQHPGDDFARSRPFGQQRFRFQAGEPGCLFVLRPDQRPPVSELPPQPPGYPLGAPDRCARLAP